jgi:hypothetical protein
MSFIALMRLDHEVVPYLLLGIKTICWTRGMAGLHTNLEWDFSYDHKDKFIT